MTFFKSITEGVGITKGNEKAGKRKEIYLCTQYRGKVRNEEAMA